MRYLFFLVIVIFPFLSSGQGWVWVRAAGGNHVAGAIRMNQGTGICTDDDGNIYVAGYFSGTGIFGKDTLNAYIYTDPVLIKFDSSGTIEWARMITDGATDYCYGICIDRAQNICVTGVTSGNDINVFTAKYNRMGDLVWINTTRCEDCIAHSKGVVSDRVGNIYVAGDCKGILDLDNLSIGAASKYTVFLIKYDVKGRILWVKQSQPSDKFYTEAHSLAIDAEGHIYLAGEFMDELHFGSAEVAGKGDADIFVARFNSEGDQEWLKSWGGKGTDRPRSIAVDNNGHFYLTAYFTSEVKLKGKVTLMGENLMKCSDAGELLWNTQVGEAEHDYSIASYVTVGNDGRPCLTGSTYGLIPLFGDKNVTWNGASDIFVAQCSTDGKPLWKLQAGDAGVDEGSAICVGGDSNIYVTGYFHKQVEFGKITIRSKSGDDGIWVGKVKPPPVSAK